MAVSIHQLLNVTVGGERREMVWQVEAKRGGENRIA